MVLLREIRELGYAGGLTQLKMFIKPLKHAAPGPVVRFETAPGEPMQVDFTVIRRGRDALLAFVATLGYSRASFVRFTIDETAETLCACLREALDYRDPGVPSERARDVLQASGEASSVGRSRRRWAAARSTARESRSDSSGSGGCDGRSSASLP